MINEISYFIVNYFSIPMPGNVLGMMILFLLLITNVIKLSWIEQGAAFLNKHLAFFFVPIAVGLMTYGGLIAESGWSLAAVLFGSSILGLAVTGGITQILAKKANSKEKVESKHERHHII